ncbi:MAG TPA: hypothetical protein VJZ04_01470 [Lachnospiraceae bacterium]|nr:hypothetical protein [Lachnospiraceae bacterium]
MFGFKSKTVYLGSSLEELNNIRELLEQNNIKYKKHLQNHSGQWLAPGRGTVRSNFGSAGMNMEYDILYEVCVSISDYEKVLFLINREKL